MNIRDFKVGMLVKINNDPTESIRRFSGGPTKRRLAGTIQKICRTKYPKNAICIRSGSSVWTFHLSDITLAEQQEFKPKPALFNPEQLMNSSGVKNES